MRRAVTVFLPLLAVLFHFGVVQAQPFGAVIYVGDNSADIWASAITYGPTATRFTVNQRASQESFECRLHVPGRHNVANALAAIAAATAAGVDMATSCSALETFTGIKRRFEIVGTRNGVTVIDDFAHNPDKIAATLQTLHAFPGRVIVMFQPHGYGPLRLMGKELVETFGSHLGSEDLLIMPDPAYYGGTTTREISSADIIREVAATAKRALYREHRADCLPLLVADRRAGDRIIIMGARDDTLSEFAAEVFAALS